jgi:hypothetical protein
MPGTLVQKGCVTRNKASFYQSHTTLLYQCSRHISRSHSISRSTDLYHDTVASFGAHVSLGLRPRLHANPATLAPAPPLGGGGGENRLTDCWSAVAAGIARRRAYEHRNGCDNAQTRARGAWEMRIATMLKRERAALGK